MTVHLMVIVSILVALVDNTHFPCNEGKKPESKSNTILYGASHWEPIY